MGAPPDGARGAIHARLFRRLLFEPCSDVDLAGIGGEWLEVEPARRLAMKPTMTRMQAITIPMKPEPRGA